MLVNGYAVDPERFSRFERYVDELGSGLANRLVLELRGHVERIAGNYVDAARILGDAIAGLGTADGPDDPFFVVTTTWWAIERSARAGLPVQLDTVLENWSIVRRAELHLLQPKGACVTAMALSAAPETDLAERFAGWARDHAKRVFEVFRVGLADFGLDDPPHRPEPDDLGELLGELNDLAAQHRSTS